MGSAVDCGEGMNGKNSWDSYDTVFLNSKAGMDGVDKKKVQKVVYEMSKGSRYFDNEQKKQAAVERRVEAMNLQAASLTPAQLAAHEKEADMKIAELEASRDLSRTWLHVDMDAFYAAVETLENSSLADKPMAVGGMSMICTANYEARKFGVRAAMPGFIARRLCPDLIFVRPDFEKYTRYSEMSRQVFRTYDANFVARSLDEAYLDITNSCRLHNLSAAEVAERLRNDVHEATGLTCSAGIGANRLLAKVCSDIKKPNGQFVLNNDRAAIMAFISSLPIRKVSGIGKVTERLLKDVLGITVCADLLTKRGLISALFSRISSDFFLAVALGVGGSEPPRDEPRKSLSNERTFAAISREVDLMNKLEELAHALAEDMQKEDLQGRTLTLKLKTTGFEVRTRAVTLPYFIHLEEDIMLHASKLLKGELPISVRLMGLRMSHFKGEKIELADRTQRTLTSFLPHSPASGSCRTKVMKYPEDLHEAGIHESAVYSASEADFMGHLENGCDDLRGMARGGNVQDDPKKDTSQLFCDASPAKSPGKGVLFKGQQIIDAGDELDCSDSSKQERAIDISEVVNSRLPGNQVPVRSSCETEACQASTYAVDDNIAGSIAHREASSTARLPDAVRCTSSGVESISYGHYPQEQIWVEDSCCSICGIKVNDCEPSARQEHEDYHFALTLQEESGGVPTLPPGHIRANDREGINKRKLSGSRQRHTSTRKATYIPIETFFNKTGNRPSKTTRR